MKPIAAELMKAKTKTKAISLLVNSERRPFPWEITQKVLTSHLRAMEKDGLVTRTVYPEVPPKVEYTLTGTGYSLKPILDSMYAWGNEYKSGL